MADASPKSLVTWVLDSERVAGERIAALRAEFRAETSPEARERITRQLAGWCRFLRHCRGFLDEHAASLVPEIRQAIRARLAEVA